MFKVKNLHVSTTTNTPTSINTGGVAVSNNTQNNKKKLVHLEGKLILLPLITDYFNYDESNTICGLNNQENLRGVFAMGKMGGISTIIYHKSDLLNFTHSFPPIPLSIWFLRLSRVLIVNLKVDCLNLTTVPSHVDTSIFEQNETDFIFPYPCFESNILSEFFMVLINLVGKYKSDFNNEQKLKIYESKLNQISKSINHLLSDQDKLYFDLLKRLLIRRYELAYGILCKIDPNLPTFHSNSIYSNKHNVNANYSQGDVFSLKMILWYIDKIFSTYIINLSFYDFEVKKYDQLVLNFKSYVHTFQTKIAILVNDFYVSNNNVNNQNKKKNSPPHIEKFNLVEEPIVDKLTQHKTNLDIANTSSSVKFNVFPIYESEIFLKKLKFNESEFKIKHKRFNIFKKNINKNNNNDILFIISNKNNVHVFRYSIPISAIFTKIGPVGTQNQTIKPIDTIFSLYDNSISNLEFSLMFQKNISWNEALMLIETFTYYKLLKIDTSANQNNNKNDRVLKLSRTVLNNQQTTYLNHTNINLIKKLFNSFDQYTLLFYIFFHLYYLNYSNKKPYKKFDYSWLNIFNGNGILEILEFVNFSKLNDQLTRQLSEFFFEINRRTFIKLEKLCDESISFMINNLNSNFIQYNIQNKNFNFNKTNVFKRCRKFRKPIRKVKLSVGSLISLSIESNQVNNSNLIISQRGLFQNSVPIQFSNNNFNSVLDFSPELLLLENNKFSNSTNSVKEDVVSSIGMEEVLPNNNISMLDNNTSCYDFNSFDFDFDLTNELL